MQGEPANSKEQQFDDYLSSPTKLSSSVPSSNSAKVAPHLLRQAPGYM
jgi:hypothetical protein